MSLSLFLLLFFVFFGSTLFMFKALFVGIFDYLLAVVPMSITVWMENGAISDLRTAAMVIAIRRIAQSYASIGI